MNALLFHKTRFYKFDIHLNIRDLFKDLLQTFDMFFSSQHEAFYSIDILRKISTFYKLLSTKDQPIRTRI